jgi:hypothetical protein
MLCELCEQRLGADDNYAAQWAYASDGSFPLVNSLEKMTPIREDRGYWGTSKKVALDRLATFAVSVVWRAHAAPGSVSRTDLGPYGEKIRSFLVGQTTFPREAAVATAALFDPTVPTDKQYHRSTVIFPTAVKRDGHHAHQFVVFGLMFSVYVGNRLPPESETTCSMTSQLKPILLLKDHQMEILSNGLRAMADGNISARLIKRTSEKG